MELRLLCPRKHFPQPIHKHPDPWRHVSVVRIQHRNRHRRWRRIDQDFLHQALGNLRFHLVMRALDQAQPGNRRRRINFRAERVNGQILRVNGGLV